MNKMIDHPNFLKLYGVFEDNLNNQNCCCILMECCDITLKDYFEADSFISQKKSKKEKITYHANYTKTLAYR